ncbi:MAG TPA: hypothetical protein VE954_04645 [Oligoflexus sp.]|uniref:hypothetical protein n=1 Tax=Oligoflexus sp. TaxID=1971216 RepID=UPI002D3A1ECF|nr:hypothetical protein [Oligoflexus sp.]HYX32379.1 hypothetical protein [Oligoflexus sp.]
MASLQSYAYTTVSYGIPYSPFSAEVDQVLLQANHASEILRTLYCLFKGKQKKVSLTFICRSAGIPSKGYLALVMNGQRRLHAKYWDSIFRTFKLNHTQRDILRAFLEMEQLNCEHSQALQYRQILALRANLQNA